MKRQLMTDTLLLMVGLVLMVYTVQTMYGFPWLCALVLAWLGFVEYALLRAWMVDLQDARTVKNRRSYERASS